MAKSPPKASLIAVCKPAAYSAPVAYVPLITTLTALPPDTDTENDSDLTPAKSAPAATFTVPSRAASLARVTELTEPSPIAIVPCAIPA